MTPNEITKARERIAESEKICEAATDGPWVGDRHDGTVKYMIVGADGEAVCVGDNGNNDFGPFGMTTYGNDEFVMGARNAWPEIVAALEAGARADEVARTCGSNGQLTLADMPGWVEAMNALRDANAALAAKVGGDE